MTPADTAILSQQRVLVADPDRFVREAIRTAVESTGAEVVEAEGPEQAMAARDADPSLTVAVLGLADSLPIVQAFRRRDRGLSIVVLAEFASVESAVAVMREGADDVLVKPVVDRELLVSIVRTVERHRLRSSGSLVAGRSDFDAVIGDDPRIRQVQEIARTAGSTRATVLMTGESGTGKSLIARAIHAASPRADGPFVEIACGSIPETLLESELFGHVAGAFTGAHVDKVGRFLAADGGTIFLDEINSASPALQLKLLRVLQERCFEPVGSNETHQVDVRIVLASNQRLEDLVADGRFRQDLYYRINVVTIDLPPLRDRRGDVRALAEAFRERFCREHGRQVAGFEPEVVARLEAHRFPGNVRELENAIERGVVLCPGHLMRLADLPESIRGEPEASRGPATATPSASSPPRSVHSNAAPASLEDALREPERLAIEAALTACGRNRTRAAAALGIDRTTLYKKMRSLGIDPAKVAA